MTPAAPVNALDEGAPAASSPTNGRVPARRRHALGVIVAVLLALVCGTGLWIRFVFDETPGPQRVTIVAPRANDGRVAFRLDRARDTPAPVLELLPVGPWIERPPGTLTLVTGPGSASYHGIVDDGAALRFVTGPDGGRARVVVDGEPGPIQSLKSATNGERVVGLHADARVPGASLALLVLMIAVSLVPAAAAVWCVTRLAARRDIPTAVAVAGGGTLVAVLVAALPYGSPAVVRAQGGFLRLLDHLGIGIAVGIAVVVAAAFVLGVRPPAAPTWVATPAGARDRWRLTLLLGAVPFVGWLALLLLFWPGFLTPDGVVQLSELDRMDFDNWHPYLFAVVIGLLKHVSASLALPIILQMTGAALLVGRVAAWTVWRGRSPWVAGAMLLLLPVLPATGLFTVTLWKDTPYGIALLGLGLVVWRIEDTKGRWLAEPRNVVLAVVTMAGVWLSRHNGWPIVIGTMVVLLLAHRAWWRRIATAVVATLAAALLVQIPLASALDVRENRVPSIAYVQHIAMHVNEGTELTRSERDFLREIYPLDREWPYSCLSIQTTWSGPQAIPLERFQDKGSELRSLAIDLALRNPGAELDHIACASEIVWKPGGDAHYFLEWADIGGRVDYIPRGFDDTPTENPASRRATLRVYDVVTNVLPTWVIRPALYLYAFLLAIAFAAWRRRSWGVARIAVPVVLQSLVLAAITLVQDARFQYGVMLTALVLVPALLVVAKRADADDDQPLRWRRADRPR